MDEFALELDEDVEGGQKVMNALQIAKSDKSSKISDSFQSNVLRRSISTVENEHVHHANVLKEAKVKESISALQNDTQAANVFGRALPKTSLASEVESKKKGHEISLARSSRHNKDEQQEEVRFISFFS